VTAAHYDDYLLLDVADLVEAAYPWARSAPATNRSPRSGVMSGPVIDVKSLH